MFKFITERKKLQPKELIFRLGLVGTLGSFTGLILILNTNFGHNIYLNETLIFILFMIVSFMAYRIFDLFEELYPVGSED